MCSAATLATIAQHACAVLHGPVAAGSADVLREVLSIVVLLADYTCPLVSAADCELRGHVVPFYNSTQTYYACTAAIIADAFQISMFLCPSRCDPIGTVVPRLNNQSRPLLCS